MSDSIIWILLIFTFLIIMGLYISEFTPLDLNEKESILKLNYLTENFSPTVSSTSSQGEGASELYEWGLPPEKINKKVEDKCHTKCEPTCPSVCPQKCPTQTCQQPAPKCPPPIQTCPQVSTYSKSNNMNEVCSKCDITLNNNIDKYVLKSSVPACPDMSEFITKNMMNANPDLSDYILKSEIKPCEKLNTSQYILKSEIPACPTCPICPECPICPICPPEKKCKEIHEYNIVDHPQISNYISMNDLKKYYVRKDEVFNCEFTKNYFKKNCGNNIVESEYVEKKPLHLPKNNEKKSIPIESNIFEESMNSELLRKDINGYYAGDSLFAGV